MKSLGDATCERCSGRDWHNAKRVTIPFAVFAFFVVQKLRCAQKKTGRSFDLPVYFNNLANQKMVVRPQNLVKNCAHDTSTSVTTGKINILRKEVIQPQVPLRLPCYDLVPIVELTFGTCSLAVSSVTSGPPDFRGLTGGVYKAQEHIHRGMLTRDY